MPEGAAEPFHRRGQQPRLDRQLRRIRVRLERDEGRPCVRRVVLLRTAKLNAAEASLSRGDTTATNQLNAFLNEVNADQSTGKLTTAQANTLRNSVDAVLGAMGAYNRFLD